MMSSKKSIFARIHFAEMITMSVAEWIALPVNPRQRNTEHHIKWAWHLRRPAPTHGQTVAGRLPDGTLHKVDGHSRAEKWKMGTLEPPSEVNVSVYNCEDEQALKDLYDFFDSASASEQPSELCTGSMRELGLNFNTPLLDKGQFAATIKTLYKKLEGWEDLEIGYRSPEFIRKCVAYFQVELVLLDEVQPVRDLFPTGIMMGALVTFMRYGQQPIEFWARYSANQGWQQNGKMDGVAALRLALIKERARQQLKGRTQDPLLGKALLAWEAYRSRYLYDCSRGIMPMKKSSLKTYLTQAKKRRT